MIPHKYQIPNYDSLPILNETQVQEMIKKGEEVVFYDELIISIKGFSHPGNSLIMEPFINNLNTNIKQSFKKYLHSDYAQLIISQRTVARLSNPNVATINQGKLLFTQVNSSPLFTLHQNTINKIDFSKPIYNQIDSLPIEQKDALTKVPTFIHSEKQVIFMNTPTQDFWYSTNFWRSNLTFQSIILVALIYLFTQQEKPLSLIHSLPFFIFGLLKWTLIEYCFHRFLLHYDLADKSFIDHHLMHHAFPQIKGKIAVSIHKVACYMVGFYLLYSLVLDKFDILVILIGVLTGLALYDGFHYYFHFGPECNIAWINSLKRHHLKHHYRNPEKGFGVSNTLWDCLFGTLHQGQNKKQVKINQKQVEN